MESLADARTNGDPIGTLAELAELGIGPDEANSCSRRTGTSAGGHKGCPWFRQCRFKPWRDQMNGLRGPLNIGVEIILSRSDGGAHNQMQAPCFGYYTMNLKARAKAAEDTGEIVRIVAYEGDGKSISSWCTRTLPPSKEHPNGKVERYLDVREVEPFKRPAERFPVESGRAVAREDMMDDLERSALAAALAKNMPPAVVDSLPTGERSSSRTFDGPVGKGRKVVKE